MIRETLELAHQTLLDNAIEHALIGGFALAVLGINRATGDIDFLVQGSGREKTIQVLVKAGFVLSLATAEVLHFEGKGRLDILLANRPLSQTMLKDAKVILPFGIKCLSAEDIIGLKIQSYKNDKKREFQDKADILALIEKFPNLDWDRIKTYAEVFGEWPFIQTLKQGK